MVRAGEVVGTSLFIVIAIAFLLILPVVIAYLIVVIFPAYAGVYWYIVALILALMVAFGARISITSRTTRSR